ncbi:hypothetical protein H696_05791 [Fonticula alba]|uniref:Uncharacterized protein n=1 Tax=Fonticula alba TaxID=691883 RepID=A0A058Z0L8_FONAL|nr:hypothetical protein H696_05791 [Fonticula alba]KCV67681.1 hypothetical protein H696_05791 [Fonticula alba]|eukprot:XP_009497865.1 hypothetical protein H696_05791 [Fonticula alba]
MFAPPGTEGARPRTMRFGLMAAPGAGGDADAPSAADLQGATTSQSMESQLGLLSAPTATLPVWLQSPGCEQFIGQPLRQLVLQQALARLESAPATGALLREWSCHRPAGPKLSPEHHALSGLSLAGSSRALLSPRSADGLSLAEEDPLHPGSIPLEPLYQDGPLVGPLDEEDPPMAARAPLPTPASRRAAATPPPDDGASFAGFLGFVFRGEWLPQRQRGGAASIDRPNRLSLGLPLLGRPTRAYILRLRLAGIGLLMLDVALLLASIFLAVSSQPGTGWLLTDPARRALVSFWWSREHEPGGWTPSHRYVLFAGMFISILSAGLFLWQPPLPFSRVYGDSVDPRGPASGADEVALAADLGPDLVDAGPIGPYGSMDRPPQGKSFYGRGHRQLARARQFARGLDARGHRDPGAILTMTHVFDAACTLGFCLLFVQASVVLLRPLAWTHIARGVILLVAGTCLTSYQHHAGGSAVSWRLAAPMPPTR